MMHISVIERKDKETHGAATNSYPTVLYWKCLEETGVVNYRKIRLFLLRNRDTNHTYLSKDWTLMLPLP